MRVTDLGLSLTLSSILEADQSRIATLSVESAAQKAVTQPSDDPAAMALILEDQEQLSQDSQGEQTSAVETAFLSQTDTVLQSVSQALLQARTLLVQAENGTLTASDRQELASQMQGILGTLVGLANTESGDSYLFNGTASVTPFTQTGNTVSYDGNESTSTVALSPGTEIAVGEPGTAIFLAQTDMATGSPQSAGALGLSGSFTVNGQSVTVTSGMTLSEIASAINAADAGARATVVSSGSQQALQISSLSTNSLTLVDGGAGILQTLGILTAGGAIANETQPSNLFDAITGALDDLQTNNTTDLANRLSELDAAQTTVGAADAFVGSQEALAKNTQARLETQDAAVTTSLDQVSGASAVATILSEYQDATTAYSAAVAAAQTAFSVAKTSSTTLG
ncbi:MAG TPA: flagellar hook-associated protein FlgL [bacterium]|nr:flagellar hook-associated protein FlgL [bacterium]